MKNFIAAALLLITSAASQAQTSYAIGKMNIEHSNGTKEIHEVFTTVLLSKDGRSWLSTYCPSNKPKECSSAKAALVREPDGKWFLMLYGADPKKIPAKVEDDHINLRNVIAQKVFPNYKETHKISMLNKNTLWKQRWDMPQNRWMNVSIMLEPAEKAAYDNALKGRKVTPE